MWCAISSDDTSGVLVSKQTSCPAPLPIPAEWVNTDVAGLIEVADAASALRSGLPHVWLAEHDETSRSFGAELWNRLSGCYGHTLLEIPARMSGVGAATLVAAWMGLRPDQVHDDIGGTVSHVVSGVGHRHDQSWHTDSTPWHEPNRYSVLALLKGAGADEESTDLLALRSLRQVLASDPTALAALKTEPVPWRRNFRHLTDLYAPVLGTPHPRWVWPVLVELMDELSADLQRGVALVARHVNEVHYYTPVVTRSHLLVFNNAQMLHRGPRLERTSHRELVRIKVAGKAIV